MIGPAALVVLLLAPTAARPVVSDGYEYLAKGKPALARTAFQNQLKKNPDDVKAKTGLALAELALGDAESATAHLLEAVKADPDDPQAHLGLARACLLRARSRIATGRGGESDTRYLLLDAESQGDRAGSLAPADPAPWSIVAEARLELGRTESAELAIAEAQKRGIQPPELRRLKAELSYSLVASKAEEGGEQAYVEARGALEELIREDPGAADLKLRLGDLHHAFGRWKEALDAWERGLTIEPFDRPTLELVLAYLKAPELAARAAQVLESARKSAELKAGGTDPRPAYALFCVGQVRLADHKLDEASALFKKARALDASLEVPCSLGMADAAYRQQHHDEAKAAWRAAFKANAVDAVALLQHLGQAASVSASLCYLADQENKKGKPGEARDLYSLALKLDPENVGLINNLAFLCRETGQLKESWEAYSKLIELAPEQPRYLNDAALLLSDYLKKDFDRARALYERSIAAADRLIADPLTPQVTREMAQSAKTDATANLARLDKRPAR